MHDRTLRHGQSRDHVQLASVNVELAKSLGGVGSIIGRVDFALDDVTPMLVRMILQGRGEDLGFGADKLSGRRIASRHDTKSTER